ncbi:hypothetical protein GCM10011386_38580 [Parapedobacter defluvii]|uniref:TerB family tellurite resistance protein n=1 Tax=Parapedobacter defluvii TaxID=2045106 RepID=A0ABQ1MM20_9SPHI|nr:hypothetical protein [Parapedobacter defluvii]GGC42618.1 hypothetical protein GCM10011386_38580 [Parapedobacter defluvii]
MESTNNIAAAANMVRRKVRTLLAIASLTAIASSFTTSAGAQTFSEWFRQKKTQKQYLAEQIIALKAYGTVLKKGYHVASSGLGIIRGFRDDEFNLHSTFFSSLAAVNPAIRDDVKIAETIALQIAIIAAFNGADNDGNHGQYIRDVKSKVLDECAVDLSELSSIVLSGKLELEDDERIRRLEKVAASMRDKAAFTQKFTGDVRLLALMQNREEIQINNLKTWFSHEDD